MNRLAAIISSLIILGYNISFSQSISKGFNFYLPSKDTTHSDFVSLLPLTPIGSTDFVTIDKEGHFSLNSNRVRFWGSNLVAGGAFPSHDSAWFIAGRLRKMGFNLIRFHHMDNPWNDESLFQQGNDTRHLNPATLDNLEYLISYLKKDGIYADINLNVSRQFNSLDGVADADSVTNMFKGVTIYDPQLISLEKEYAKQLLTHVNPYTQLPLVNDPVMAMVEVVNENSLYRMWHDGQLKPLAQGGQLLFRHSIMLDTMWNTYLKGKYSTNENLSSAWSEGESNGTNINIIKNGTFEDPYNSSSWIMELDTSAVKATMTRDSTTAYEGKYSAKVTVTAVTGSGWRIQWKQTGFSLYKDSTYTLTIAAKTDTPKTITLYLMRENSPWTVYAGRAFSLTTQWQVFSFSLKPSEDNVGEGRFSFQLDNTTGTFWLDSIAMSVSPTRGLLHSENLDSGTVKRIDYSGCSIYTDNRIKDMSDFYITLQTNFFKDMKSYLKDTLGLKVPIVGTNWNIGAGDLISQAAMDYIDNHAYWDHPSFPHVPWSPTDWYIQNQPMMKSTDEGTIPDLFGGVGMTGKPFTVSEYNHPYPNIYETEAVPFITAYSSLQDADAIMFFDYASLADEWSADQLNGYFDLGRNNAMMALMPSCSFAFRNDLISKATQLITLNYTRDAVLILPKNDPGNWDGPSMFSRKLALLHEVRNGSFDATTSSNFGSLNPEVNPPFVSDTKEIIYNTGGLFSIGTKNFLCASGFLDDFKDQQIGNLIIKSADGFGTITWLSLDADSLTASRKSLITISTIQQNTGMLWDGTTTVHDNWGTAPTQVYPLNVNLNLILSADSIRVFPLDVLGTADSLHFYSIKGIEDTFNLTLNQNVDATLWYGVEAYGNGVPTDVSRNTFQITKFALYQNYPNPFNPATLISYELSSDGFVILKVYDVLGREIKTLISDREKTGTHSVTFAAPNISSGIYFYRIITGGYVSTKKMLLLK